MDSTYFLKVKSYTYLRALLNFTTDNKEIHPPSYTRWCELERAEKNILTYIAKEENTTIMVADIPVCDPDGHYYPIQSQNQKWICVDPNGDQIESFEQIKENAKPNVPENMNCRKFTKKKMFIS